MLPEAERKEVHIFIEKIQGLLIDTAHANRNTNGARLAAERKERERLTGGGALLSAKNGDRCYYGGHPSRIIDGVCRHPSRLCERWNLSSILGKCTYQSEYDKFQSNHKAQKCTGRQFACPSNLFGSGICVNADTTEQRRNLTKNCETKSRDKNQWGDIGSINDKEAIAAWNAIAEESSDFCVRNPSYNACKPLDLRIGGSRLKVFKIQQMQVALLPVILRVQRLSMETLKLLKKKQRFKRKLIF